MSVRIEKDTFGPIEVPSDCLWGAQTARSLKFFAISSEKIPQEVLRALANAILDIRLQTMDMTDQQALDLMMKDTYQEKEEATAKLQRAQLSSCQLPMYYSGWKGWLEVREHYKQRKGAAYSLKAFHDAALKESEEFLQTIADNLPGLVSYWDNGMRCRFANKAYSDWWGLSPAQMIGQTLREILPVEELGQYEPRFAAALRGEPQRMERPDGRLGRGQQKGEGRSAGD